MDSFKFFSIERKRGSSGNCKIGNLEVQKSKMATSRIHEFAQSLLFSTFSHALAAFTFRVARIVFETEATNPNFVFGQPSKTSFSRVSVTKEYNCNFANRARKHRKARSALYRKNICLAEERRKMCESLCHIDHRRESAPRFCSARRPCTFYTLYRPRRKSVSLHVDHRSDPSTQCAMSDRKLIYKFKYCDETEPVSNLSTWRTCRLPDYIFRDKCSRRLRTLPIHLIPRLLLFLLLFRPRRPFLHFPPLFFLSFRPPLLLSLLLRLFRFQRLFYFNLIIICRSFNLRGEITQ